MANEHNHSTKQIQGMQEIEAHVFAKLRGTHAYRNTERAEIAELLKPLFDAERTLGKNITISERDLSTAVSGYMTGLHEVRDGSQAFVDYQESKASRKEAFNPLRLDAAPELTHTKAKLLYDIAEAASVGPKDSPKANSEFRAALGQILVDGMFPDTSKTVSAAVPSVVGAEAIEERILQRFDELKASAHKPKKGEIPKILAVFGDRSETLAIPEDALTGVATHFVSQATNIADLASLAAITDDKGSRNVPNPARAAAIDKQHQDLLDSLSRLAIDASSVAIASRKTGSPFIS